MGKPIPQLSEAEFRARLDPHWPPRWPVGPADTGSQEARAGRLLRQLYEHFQELRRWNPTHNLIGPGTVDAVPERHYREALAAVPWIRESDRTLVDLGSGAGFPGWVLAAALPHLDVWLIEARQKKCAFLEAASRRAGLSCRSLGVRVEKALPDELPQHIDVVTVRALKVWPEVFDAFGQRFPRVRFLLWHGRSKPDLPAGWTARRQKELPGGEGRSLLEVARMAGASPAGK